MPSKLKTTLVAGTAALVAALSGVQAADAHGFRHFNSFLLGGLHDNDDDSTNSYDRDDAYETDAAATAAAYAARRILGVDDGMTTIPTSDTLFPGEQRSPRDPVKYRSNVER